MPFHSLLPEIAQREVRCIHLQPAPGVPLTSGLSAGEYAFVEFYCEDLNCDCRRVFIQVLARHQQDQVLASINYGWEEESFYRERMSYDPDAPRQIVQGSLDPINTQSEHSEELLELFQQHVLDESKPTKPRSAARRPKSNAPSASGSTVNRAFVGASSWKRSRTSASQMEWSSPGKWPSKWVMCRRMRDWRICCEDSL